MNLYLEIIIWLLIWGAGMGFCYVVLRPKNIYYYTKSFANILWYGLVSMFTAWYYYPLLEHLNLAISAVIIACLATIISFFYYRYVSSKAWYLNDGKYIYFFLSKTLELIFQQIAIFALFVILLRHNFNIIEMVGIFVAVHIPLIFFLKSRLALFLICSSCVGGILFFYLYASISGGVYFAFSLHVLFYVLTNYLTIKNKLPAFIGN